MLKTIKAFCTKFCKGVILFLLFSLLNSFTIIQLDTDSSDSDSETGKGKKVADPVKSDQVGLTQSNKISDCEQVSYKTQSDKVSDCEQVYPKTQSDKVSD